MQCSIELFGCDTKELRGMCGTDTVCCAQCEECGCIYVDREGRCVDENCKKHGVRTPRVEDV